MNKILSISIIAVLFLFTGSTQGMMDNHAFYIPFLTDNNYNPDLDESLDPDYDINSTDSNGSDY